MNTQDAIRYDILVCGSARVLAATYTQDVTGLREALIALGVTDEGNLEGVHEMQTDKDYEEYTDGLGLVYAEGVYEAIKDCLCPVYGF